MSKNKRNFKKVLAVICAFSGAFGGNNSGASAALKNKRVPTVETDVKSNVKSENLSLNRQSGNKNFFGKAWDLIKTNPIKSGLITAGGLTVAVGTPLLIAKLIKGKKDDKETKKPDTNKKDDTNGPQKKSNSEKSSKKIPKANTKEDIEQKQKVELKEIIKTNGNESNNEQEIEINKKIITDNEQNQNEEKEEPEDENKNESDDDEFEPVIEKHEEFWNNLEVYSNFGSTVVHPCKLNNIGLGYSSDKLVKDFFSEFNDGKVKKFYLAKNTYAFITKTENLSESARSAENEIYIHDFGCNYAVIVVSKDNVWELCSNFNCKLNENLNVEILEK